MPSLSISEPGLLKRALQHANQPSLATLRRLATRKRKPLPAGSYQIVQRPFAARFAKCRIFGYAIPMLTWQRFLSGTFRGERCSSP